MKESRWTILTTDRVRITTWLASDLQDLAVLHADPLTMRFIGHGRPETVDEARARIAEYRDEQRVRGWTKCRVANRDGDMIGRAGFGESSAGRELAYALRPDQWNRGLATEIASGLVRWHIEHPTVDQSSNGLCAHVEAGNHASVRVLEKAGFHFVDKRFYKGATCDYFECSAAAGACTI
ncbi:RimJ/RimL family protein N-acetyltransferase [Rhodococcus sp. SMB37]|uniref:GNAT family N-acetyltransferase n=1 Tax=Rhodococcus sp. SMB37 TaxID=2512213 RepID=UPI00104A465C|nr:GNAT family N-acetyltransferase [Rhodococcus sp. SMB37]TCN51306.1 RimJ/RimL family protein N-acetyltransferase [Rhodococcus sp. SMB37]